MGDKEKDFKSLGKVGLIDLLTNNIELKNESSVIGIGDDAAIVDHKHFKTVVTSDLLTEGIHFDLIYTPLKHLGYKSVIVNLSDIYAMNAIPQQIIVSIAVSAKFSAEMLEELYAGIKLACEYYKVDLVGGDTTSSLTGLTISITALGMVEDEKTTYRKGAQPKNLLCVSGDLGGAFLGLQLLEREKKVFNDTSGVQPDLTDYDYILERQLKPEARHDIIEALAEQGIKPTSMIDISDGLASECLHIAKASNVGMHIYADRIPIAPETKQATEDMELEPVIVALNGGEDYELLFTIGIDDHEKIKNVDNVSIIGHITDENDGCYLILADNTAVGLKAIGWEGFSDISPEEKL